MPLTETMGYVVSSYINWRLQQPLTRKQRMDWVDYANRYPNWLRSVSEDILVPTNFGFDIFCDRRSGIGQTLVMHGQWEGLLSRTILACLQPGDVALDIGANIGYDSLLMSQAVGPSGTIFAFEPETENCALLLKNIRHARHANIVPISIGVSDGLGLGKISIENSYNRGKPNMRPGQDGATRTILATRLDQLLDLMDVPNISLVKMDIEGFEFKAIVGLGKLIDRVDALTCEINHGFLEQCGSSAEDIFGYMYAKGFKSFCADSQSDDVWTAFDHRYRVTSDKGTHFDVLFCREVKAALDPLISKGS